MRFKIFVCIIAISIGFIAQGCSGQKREQTRTVLDDTQGTVTINGDVWADNWFALYIGDKLLIEDSVSIKTERSFNAETFSFKADYPIVLNFVVKDFKEDDSGLEYIGTRKQQMGDGGFIAQFKDAGTGKLLAATNSDWRCLVLHHGPVEDSCASEKSPVAGKGPCAFITTEEPSNWKSAEFSINEWQKAREYSVSEVRPKDGYDRVAWHNNARLIWSGDLKKDNTILFRIVIDRP